MKIFFCIITILIPPASRILPRTPLSSFSPRLRREPPGGAGRGKATPATPHVFFRKNGRGEGGT
ncbi:hypothetical protein PUN28_015302 [Cardiocondyla obscurior]|uniref:Uncharacterized protein n=1 Tax=Cardiocondyla obscurior TaxID=286306 RepID=A0AAW2EWN7_9HYME